jgi:hypothetical protein
MGGHLDSSGPSGCRFRLGPDGRAERIVHAFSLRHVFRYEAEHLLFVRDSTSNRCTATSNGLRTARRHTRVS